MSERKAIEVLKTYDMSEDNEDKEFIEAIKTAISVLERQMAKKPIPWHANSSITDCPCCEAIVIESQSFCDECGQKLDWSK